MTKIYPTLDVRSTLSDPLVPDPTTTLDLSSAVPSNTPTPAVTNTLFETTEFFKTVVNYSIEDIPFLFANMYYEPETVPPHLEEIIQELNDAAANYQSGVPHLSK